MENLNLFCSHNYSDLGMEAIVKKCSKLESIELDYNEKISAEIFRQVPAQYLTRLQLVSLGGCVQVFAELVSYEVF